MKVCKTMFSLVALLFLWAQANADSHEVLEIDVAGMTCTFCAYGIEKNLGKLDGVDKAEVSLELKKARVTMKPGVSADEVRIREVIRDGGFTPNESSRHTEESE